MQRILAALLCSLLAGVAIAQNTDLGGAKAMKTLVVYYSLTGKTEVVAQALARELGADLRRVEDAESRAPTWWLMVSGSMGALRGAQAPIKPIDTSLQAYERVFVGSPVWAGSPSTPINAFIGQADFSGKQVVPFMTMGGKDAAGALRKMSERIEKKGGRVTGSFALSSGDVTNEALANQVREIAQRYR